MNLFAAQAHCFLVGGGEAIGNSTRKHYYAEDDGDNVANSKSIAENHEQNRGDGHDGGKHFVGFDELEHDVSFR